MEKKITFLVAFLIFGSALAFSQEEARKIQEEINEKVWKPFVEAYNNFDAEAFNALHSDDVLRVNPWGIRIGAEYKEKMTESFGKSKKGGEKRSIEFWLEHRQSTPALSYEVGYYKIIVTRDGKESTHFARFHVVIRKIDGTWKIVQDWDTNDINGQKVTEADYLKGEPLKF